MSYLVLARKYRSSTFDEVVGQNHVAQTLKKAIESGRIAHAYLFCGTRGVGKTSMARILAKALNCEKAGAATSEPCLECASCKAIARGEDMDVIEIDAASNTQVDKTREVILDNAQYRPARSRFKVYIIDEVHMLSKASFNALLKTLEEPPPHVKFILATTEPEKVLPTILSRCQRYDFRNIPTREIAEHLKHICQDEQIKADEEALMLVAKAGAGSMRDALSLLDRLLSIGEKELTVQTLEQLLGLPRSQLILQLVQHIGEGDVKGTLGLADQMIRDGLSPDALLASLVDHFRNLLILRTCGADSGLVEVAGLAVAELAKQAERFDPVVLTQDITILEDLRRQLRASQAGRALVDATLVRLALAEQFTAIADLLGRVEGSGGAAVQKKKFEPSVGAGVGATVGAGSNTSHNPKPLAAPASAVSSAPSTGSKLPVAPVVSAAPAVAVAAAPVRSPANNVVSTVAAAAEVMPAASTAEVPAAPAVEVASEDGDDDLPRPGKVWSDGPKVSLSTLMARHSAATTKAAAPAPAASSGPGVQAVGSGNLSAVWERVLKLVHEQSAPMYSLVSAGRLTGIVDEQAVLRYSPANETFVKLLGRGGKKEHLGELFSQVVGRNIGVRFEIDAAEESSAAATPGGAVASPATPGQARGTAAPAAAPPPASAQSQSGRVTPEQAQEFAKIPLVAAIMKELDGMIVKLSEE